MDFDGAWIMVFTNIIYIKSQLNIYATLRELWSD